MQVHKLDALHNQLYATIYLGVVVYGIFCVHFITRAQSDKLHFMVIGVRRGL